MELVSILLVAQAELNILINVHIDSITIIYLTKERHHVEYETISS